MKTLAIKSNVILDVKNGKNIGVGYVQRHENDLITFFDNGNNKMGQLLPEITINKKVISGL